MCRTFGGPVTWCLSAASSLPCRSGVNKPFLSWVNLRRPIAICSLRPLPAPRALIFKNHCCIVWSPGRRWSGCSEWRWPPAPRLQVGKVISPRRRASRPSRSRSSDTDGSHKSTGTGNRFRANHMKTTIGKVRHTCREEWSEVRGALHQLTLFSRSNPSTTINNGFSFKRMYMYR